MTPRVEVRARSREMRAAVTVFRGIARNCVITLRFSPVSARGANT